MNFLVEKRFKTDQDVLDRKFVSSQISKPMKEVLNGKICLKKNRKRSSAEEEDSVQIWVEHLDELLFDYDEIKVPVVVELQREEAELPTRSHQTSACYDLKSLDMKMIPAGEHVFFNFGLAFKIQQG